MRHSEIDEKLRQRAKLPVDDFTGRGSELQQFDAKLKSYREKPVWFLEGVGGVGKSELLKTFRQVCRERSLPCAYLDLSADSCLSEAGLLNEIAKELGPTDFPYFRKVYDSLEKLEKAQRTITDLAEGVMKTGSLGASVTPVGGAVDHLKQRVGGWMGRKEAELLADSSERLFATFTSDLNRYASEEGRELPVVLMLDTYEQASPVQQDVIRHLALFCDYGCKRVLFIVAGRDKPEWEDFDPSLIDGQGLDDLPEGEAEEYLNKRRITDQSLRERILRLTKCFPFFLRMACDIVDAMKESGQTPTADEFPMGEFTRRQVADFLVKRLIERLPKGTERLESAIKILGIPRWFDEAVFAALQGAKASDVGSDWRALETTCLVQPTEHPGRYKYYDCVRDAILSWWKGSEDEAAGHHKILAGYHGKDQADFTHVREWLYHRMAYEPIAATKELANLCRLCLAAVNTTDLALLLSDIPEYPVDYASLAQPDIARVHFSFGYAYNVYPTKRFPTVRAAINEYQSALTFYSEKDFPQNWAMTQNNLGNAYWDLPTGDRGENLRKAIECYEAALRVYTEKDSPQDWSATQNNLGTVYAELPTGDRGENLRKAIECYEAALRVRTEKDFPQYWATNQNNLGTVYADLPTGDRGENLRKAIECFEAALRVRTEKDLPQGWAATQNNLGIAHRTLPTGDRGENLKKAIECYEAALRVYTEKDLPQGWAATQNNLGIAHRTLPTGDRGENLKKAIECYEAALRVYTEKDFPQDWAMTQNNLGNAYSDLPTGDRGENLKKAIECFEAALRVRTEKDFPQDWAMTSFNIGLAWLEVDKAKHSRKSLEIALSLFNAAARGYRTVGNDPEAEESEDMARRVRNLLDGKES